MDPFFEQERRRALRTHLIEHHGAVTPVELRSLGFGPSSIATLVRNGELERVGRGRYRSSLVPRSPEGALRGAFQGCRVAMAAVLMSSAHAQGLFDDAPPRPQLGAEPSAIGATRRRRAYDLHPLTKLQDGDLIECGDIVVTSPLRTCLDLGRRPRNRGQRNVAASVLRAAARADESIPASLLDRVAAQPRVPGNQIVRDLVAELPGTLITRSPLEVDFVAFCAEHDLPLPLTNHVVVGIEVDAAFVLQRLAIELDTRAYHDTDDTFERDRERDALLMLAGWRVLRITRNRLERQPLVVAEQIRQLLAAGGGD